MGYKGVVCTDAWLLDALRSVSVRPTGLMNAQENAIHKFTKGLWHLFIRIDDGINNVKLRFTHILKSDTDTNKYADGLYLIVRVPMKTSAAELQFVAYKYSVIMLCAYDRCGKFDGIDSKRDPDLFKSTVTSYFHICKELSSKFDDNTIDWEIFDKEPFNEYTDYIFGGVVSDEN